MEVRKMAGWKEMKNAEQCCFSIGKTEERLLAIGVSATGKVAANGVAEKERGKAKQVLDGVVSRMRMMGGGRLECLRKWEEMESAEPSCFSIRKKVTSLPQRCFSVGKMNSAVQRCSGIMKNHQCYTTVFRHREKSSVLHIGVSAS
jgi:hypothetical protein